MITRDELAELERSPRTRTRVVLDRLVCALPLAAGALVLVQYYFVPNHGGNVITEQYAIFIAFFMALLFVALFASLFSNAVFRRLRFKAPFYTLVFCIFLGWDYLTLKTGILILPFFPWPDRILNAMTGDADMLLDCVKNSLILLFSGYFLGSGAGLLTGIACGVNKKFDYWISPVMKILGPIPSVTWLPIIVVLASSLFSGSVFLIALGVWYPVTLSTLTGISNIRKIYFEVAQTLGAGGRQLIFRVAVPSALPNIFQGLTQGMSVACTTLLVAEMMGVKSGLGWYITWQKSWAEFAKMYSAIILICLTFMVVNQTLSLLRKRILRWREGMTQ
ncbi:MAG: ABC transporter permease subunit [Synergistaceae bacterium]|jgi:NitT/TauT family transport system permease protein|nr:ABC transporter permease subunit [Synergistaceae bacterium]